MTSKVWDRESLSLQDKMGLLQSRRDRAIQDHWSPDLESILDSRQWTIHSVKVCFLCLDLIVTVPSFFPLGIKKYMMFVFCLFQGNP